ncbi:FimV/HubP family polar landmark protein [Stenotrophomonas maltophilia]|uniref:FimV/HubP family polar landmark protein n=1 Tax=Stenotrophomonas maltophilia TaxID=40324 RepID=UPI0012AEEF9D|nr:FimV/HubP family polar landmark protein [Stenotrophomonas maltophilia]ELC7364281.1 fimbrial protein FimV [Stenotrophomonas maltophilia]MBA0252045.1 fimbrial protein FimV [Stenotrophomonas maltophilia]MBA0318401.1 fimbrial protein FimV [Stenotrophomonas maltophilia]MBH1631096.1 fimbrial protein FimV [Stenotrophomonas maltophilia]MCU1145822.1 fimbrial protein FimV [Stenotrophomonas maltophilia]
MNKRAKGAKRPLSYLSAALLALASSSALALGLGDIRVLSKPGQPLLAEIPVVSADPSELENLRVALASPVTFERVGLQRPTGLVSELQFELTRDTQGRAVVRVTSQAPVETPSLSFLIEADWGQGRLVREYSALVDAPPSALAVAEPEIVAPAGTLSDTIMREPAPASATAPAAATPTTPPPAVAPAPARPRAASAPVAAPAADGSITVRRGQTLSQIASAVARGNQVSRDRAMIALLRANPEAFIRGNVNLLKQGAVLRMPGSDALAAVDAAEAVTLVREHAAQWRQARTVPQPAGAVAPVAKAAATNASSPAAANGARLEIAPALASDAVHAGTTTGTAAGSEGDMLGNEQLRQAREDIATRDAEIGELKQRVADLEKLKEQQQSLIAMKDNDLAAAQQRLAQAPDARDAATPWYWLGLPVLLLAAGAAWLLRRRKPSPLPPLREEDDAAGLAAAVPAGAALDTLAEQSSWSSAVADGGRQEPAMPAWASEPEAPAETVVDPVVSADWQAGTLRDDGMVALPEAVTDLPRWDEPVTTSSAGVVEPVHDELVASETPVETGVPDYALHAEQQPQFRGVFDLPADAHENEAPADAARPEAIDGIDHGSVEASHSDDIASSAVAPAGDAGWSPRAGQERLELAIAYLDLGDAQTARTLLLEVAEDGDLHSQAQARELLARLP